MAAIKQPSKLPSFQTSVREVAYILYARGSPKMGLTEKQLAVMPWIEETLVWGKVSMKSELMRMPLTTPWGLFFCEIKAVSCCVSGVKNNTSKVGNEPDHTRTTPEPQNWLQSARFPERTPPTWLETGGKKDCR